MEHTYSASMDKVFTLLTNPRWLEARSAALGELSAKVTATKRGGGITLRMKRRVKRELPGLVAKVLSPESDLVFEESWAKPGEGGHSGTLTMGAVSQPVKMTASFELAPAGKGCVYRIKHACKCSLPLIGGAVERFALGQVESGCADELACLAQHLKPHKP